MMVTVAGLGINYGVKSKKLLIKLQEEKERNAISDESDNK